MPSGDRRVPLEKLREAVRAAVAKTTIRQVAGEIGVEHNTIARFLRGATPYSANRAKMETWFSGGEASELERCRQEVAELRKALAECEAKLRRSR
jgi:transposase-like protein